jgi:hypothetical protein
MVKNSSMEIGCLRRWRKVSPFDVLHDQPEFAGVLDYIVDCADIGVVERGGALRFLEQTFAVGLVELGDAGAMRLMATERLSVVSSAL